MVNKLKTSVWTRWIILSSLFLFPNIASAQLFGDDDKKWENLLLQIKFINTRLQKLDKDKLVTMQSLQEDSVRQIEEIKNIFPGFQSSLNDNTSGIEQNSKALRDALDRISALETQLNNKMANLTASIEDRLNKTDNAQRNESTRLKDDIKFQLDGQNTANDAFRKDMVDKLKQLQDGMALDLENLNKNSSMNFQNFSQTNQQALEKVVASLNSQSQKAVESQNRLDNLVRNDIVPALKVESDNNRTALLADLEKLRVSIEQALQSHQAGLNSNKAQLQANLQQVNELSAGVKTWNDELIGILKQNLQINTQTRETVNGVSGSLKDTDKNIASVGMQFQQVADAINTLNSKSQARENSIASIQIGVANLESAEKLRDKKVDQLLETSVKIVKHDLAMETALTNTDKLVQENRAQLSLSNEKLTSLIEILKTIAQEQNAIQKVVQGNDSGSMLKEVAAQVKGLTDSNIETGKKLLQSQNQLVTAQNRLMEETQKTNQELLKKQNSLNETSKLVLQSQNELVTSQNGLLQVSQQGMDQLLQEQKSLSETSKLVMQSQNDVVESYNELLKSAQGGSGGGASPAQIKEIIDRLADLRNKGNLNISLNQQIKKAVSGK